MITFNLAEPYQVLMNAHNIMGFASNLLEMCSNWFIDKTNEYRGLYLIQVYHVQMDGYNTMGLAISGITPPDPLHKPWIIDVSLRATLAVVSAVEEINYLM